MACPENSIGLNVASGCTCKAPISGRNVNGKAVHVTKTSRPVAARFDANGSILLAAFNVLTHGRMVMLLGGPISGAQ